jgi:phosphohistidine swiveling domain-containing protein
MTHLIYPEYVRGLDREVRERLLREEVGGKGKNLFRMTALDLPVPQWFAVSAKAFQKFQVSSGIGSKIDEILITVQRQLAVAESRGQRPEPAVFDEAANAIEKLIVSASLSSDLLAEIKLGLEKSKLDQVECAVRSSGLDEDSVQNSFAGQFSSFLFQKGIDAISNSLKKCWASGFSARALSYRYERGLGLSEISVGVVIQKMVHADRAGVAFSRNPIRALDRDSLLIASVFGLGEGLVSGYLESDSYEVSRSKRTIKADLVTKDQAFRRSVDGGLEIQEVSSSLHKTSSLTDEEVLKIADLCMDLERNLGTAQDCEWAIENGQVYFVQTRPVTSLPPDAYFESSSRGKMATLWDNSNIIESYSGVTTPLTFSFASRAYRQVYIQFCEVMGIPQAWIDEREEVFRNMLGLIRGRIFYNLVNWYKLVLLLPGSANNKSFMETMMGVKQGLKPEVAKLFEFVNNPPRYSLLQKVTLLISTYWRFKKIDHLVSAFNHNFIETYEDARKKPYKSYSFDDLVSEYHRLEDRFLKRWQVPIINDYLCMIFFGLLKKLTEKWVAKGDEGGSLQNDLLCGQGDLESTEPTKTLMRIAKVIDKGDPEVRNWFIETKPADVWSALVSKNSQEPVSSKRGEIYKLFENFLDRYGFRCINELKLEEKDLHDDPTFVVGSVQSYVRTGSYDVEKMEARELEIRGKAERILVEKVSGPKLAIYTWVLNETRRAVRNRENLRFARTKVFGVARKIIRAMGHCLKELGFLRNESDVFYLTIEELIAFNEGRTVTLDLATLAELRKKEFASFDKTQPPPDRFLLEGAVGMSLPYGQVLAELDLLRSERPRSDDPNVLLGTPCCPGVVEGVVRVVKEMKDAEGIAGEILVTERTDPGWVPLYPSCSGLLIERGSLLSHSAVVARELGLPTIVGISGGLMKKLKTGDRVRVDGAKGEVRILQESEV